jgi:hypothetical protein
MASATYGHLALPYPMAIADKNGNNGVAFAYLSEPPILPEIMYDRKTVDHEMGSPGLGKRGIRVMEVFQTAIGWSDAEFAAELITPDQLDRIRGYIDGTFDGSDPGYVSFTPGGLSYPTTYLGILAQDPRPGNYRFNGRLFHKVQIKIKIIKVEGTINYGNCLPVIAAPLAV